MSNNDYSEESYQPECEEVTRTARFKATRAILNAQTQAKLTNRSFQPKTIACRGITSPNMDLFNNSDEN